jgi:hypothetical protein
MKLNIIQIHEAHVRAVYGESVRSIARSMAVTEGALRFHFRKGTHPRAVRRLAFCLFETRQLMDQLTPARRSAAKKMAQSMGAD